ncbi:hypothetical protein ABZP36_031677 [Zizania latifolia]
MDGSGSRITSSSMAMAGVTATLFRAHLHLPRAGPAPIKSSTPSSPDSFMYSKDLLRRSSSSLERTSGGEWRRRRDEVAAVDEKVDGDNDEGAASGRRRLGRATETWKIILTVSFWMDA